MPDTAHTRPTFLAVLSQTRLLWASFIATIVLTISFGIVIYLGDFGIIDEMYIADDIRAHIDAMLPAQRVLHAWMTGTLDVAYPFAYGAFFIGVAVRFLGRLGPWFALPGILVIPADLTEGFAQIMLLTGHDGFMALKVVATQIKLTLFLSGLLITIVGLLFGVWNKIRRRSGTA